MALRCVQRCFVARGPLCAAPKPATLTFPKCTRPVFAQPKMVLSSVVHADGALQLGLSMSTYQVPLRQFVNTRPVWDELPDHMKPPPGVQKLRGMRPKRPAEEQQVSTEPAKKEKKGWSKISLKQIWTRFGWLGVGISTVGYLMSIGVLYPVVHYIGTEPIVDWLSQWQWMGQKLASLENLHIELALSVLGAEFMYPVVVFPGTWLLCGYIRRAQEKSTPITDGGPKIVLPASIRQGTVKEAQNATDNVSQSLRDWSAEEERRQREILSEAAPTTAASAFSATDEATSAASSSSSSTQDMASHAASAASSTAEETPPKQKHAGRSDKNERVAMFKDRKTRSRKMKAAKEQRQKKRAGKR